MAEVTVNVPDEMAGRLDKLAEKLGQTRSHVTIQAIEDFIAREEWQLAEIQAGLREAERGAFATPGLVADIAAKYSATVSRS